LAFFYWGQSTVSVHSQMSPRENKICSVPSPGMELAELRPSLRWTEALVAWTQTLMSWTILTRAFLFWLSSEVPGGPSSQKRLFCSLHRNSFSRFLFNNTKGQGLGKLAWKGLLDQLPGLSHSALPPSRALNLKMLNGESWGRAGQRMARIIFFHLFSASGSMLGTQFTPPQLIL
jgi:hypothetical protein